jgi:iron-sulfur cluster protein
MPNARYAKLNEDISKAISEPKNRNALYRCMKHARDTRAQRLATMPHGAAFRDEVKAIKDRCNAKQDELLERFTAKAKDRGAKVFIAKDGPEAIKYCLDVAKAHGASTVSKSKSLTTEEIEMNEDMEKAGLRVVETDLGELIIQLVGDRPYHLVFPSVHKMKEEVAEIFAKETGQTIQADIASIMPVVREYLRPIFLNTDIGMTGANVGIADSGGIVIETNEGNARLVSSIGKVHICVMGMEKIVETEEDALMMVLAHPVSATGQMPTTYVTWMGGRNPIGTDGPPRESHIVILDNGRSDMAQDPIMKEALNCIRCGACMNICPTYGVVGGHAFGHIYPGPIGIPWTAEVHGLENAADFAELCVSCGLCKEICPAEIDIPFMIAEVKHRDMATNPPSAINRRLMAAESMAKLGSATAPLSNWALSNPLVRGVMEKAIGIERKRKLPAFARNTLVKRMKGRPSPKGAQHKVAFFYDIYANYNAPELGMAAIEHLEAAGCEVVLPTQRACGYPYIGYGDLDKARESAAYNVSQLVSYAKDGYSIVTTEPTAAYCLKLSYPKLLDKSEDSLLVAAQTSDYFEFLISIESKSDAKPLAGRRFGFHCPCHERPLGGGSAAMDWVRRQGAEVEFIESGTCCGMAGTFGLKHGPLGYGLANAVGEPLFKAFKESSVEAIVTESSVCAIHLAEGTGLPVKHPLEL